MNSYDYPEPYENSRDRARWAQYESHYDPSINGSHMVGDDTPIEQLRREWQPEDEAVAAADKTLAEIATEAKFKDIDETFELPHHDTARGVIRPRLIVLNAWLEVCREMSSEGQWGQDLAEELCDDDWCKQVLMTAGVSEVEATAWADSEWK